MLAWIAPIVVFGLVVFVHEFGHFIAAKLFGVYTPRFSIGFGPALVKWRRGETEYKLAVFPLGGYVRMASRLDEESAFLEGGSEESAELSKDYDPNAMIPFGPKPIPENRWFESKPFYARLVILLAGVTMNMVLGWAINVGLSATYGHDITTRLSQVAANKPAALAGIQAGDSIVALNGTPVHKWEPLRDQISQATGRPLNFDLLRNGQHIAVTVTPQLDTLVDEMTGDTIVQGIVGMVAGVDSSHHLSVAAAISDGTQKTVDMATLVFSALQKIATHRTSVTELGGPIAIAQTSVQAARAGMQVLFYLVALISVNLAVFNLLPIPILDGGQIVVQAVESARGRPLTDRAREYVARVGLAFIVLLFVTVTFNDIKRLILSFIAH